MAPLSTAAAAVQADRHDVLYSYLLSHCRSSDARMVKHELKDGDVLVKEGQPMPAVYL